MNSHSGSSKKPLTFDDVTNWYLPEEDGQPSLVYPGATKVEGELALHAKKLRQIVLHTQANAVEVQKDWRFEYKDIAWRAHRQRTVDGIMYMLRKIPTVLPILADLNLPKQIVDIVTMQNFASRGGLLLIGGEPGHGKSTTLAAIIHARVKSHGYFCLTVEDPPEFPLHGDYPSTTGRIGKVVQVPAEKDSFAEDLRDALRCYPSDMRGSMLMVGEVRDGDTALQVIRAANNGLLVLATVHAGDPLSAITRMMTLAQEKMSPEEARQSMAMSLRGVLQQRLDGGRVSVEHLLSLNGTSSVASRIRSGSIAQLSTDVSQQKVQAQSNRLWEFLQPTH
jgi:Tfp pilus assembly pilus retraction ATPase PilT